MNASDFVDCDLGAILDAMDFEADTMGQDVRFEVEDHTEASEELERLIKRWADRHIRVRPDDE